MRINEPINTHEYVLPDGTVIVTSTDLNGHIRYVNDAFLESSELSMEECVGQPQNIIRHWHMPPEVFEDMWRTIRGGRRWTGMIKNRRKGGGFYWVRASVTPIREEGRTVGYMSVRVKPSAHEIVAADELYRDMRAGRASHIRLRGGVPVDLRPRRLGRALH